MFGNMDPNGPPPDMGGFMSGLMNNFMGGGGGKSSAPSGGMKGPQGFDDILSKDMESDIPSVVSLPKKKSGRSLHV